MQRLSFRLVAAVIVSWTWSVASPGTSGAQQRTPPVGLTHRSAAPLVRNLRARTTSVTDGAITTQRDSVPRQRTHRVRHALIGGALGSMAGVAACYYIVGFGSDTGDTAACRPLGRVMFAVGGFGVGGLVGALFPLPSREREKNKVGVTPRP